MSIIPAGAKLEVGPPSQYPNGFLVSEDGSRPVATQMQFQLAQCCAVLASFGQGIPDERQQKMFRKGMPDFSDAEKKILNAQMGPWGRDHGAIFRAVYSGVGIPLTFASRTFPGLEADLKAHRDFLQWNIGEGHPINRCVRGLVGQALGAHYPGIAMDLDRSPPVPRVIEVGYPDATAATIQHCIVSTRAHWKRIIFVVEFPFLDRGDGRSLRRSYTFESEKGQGVRLSEMSRSTEETLLVDD